MEDYVSDFQIGGVVKLERDLAEIKYKDSSGEDLFIVRLSNIKNDTVFLSIPQQWPKPDFKQAEDGAWKDRAPWSFVPSNGVKNTYEIFSKPLSTDLILQVGKLTSNSKELIEHFRAIFLQILIPIFLIGVAGGLFFTFRALRPIRYLINTTRLIIDTGEISSRVPTGGRNDELKELSRLFNTMLEKIENLIRGMREGLDNVAHDLRTPITRIRGSAEMSLRSEDNPDILKSTLADCIEETDRILTMLNTIMDISEAETGTMRLNLQNVKIAALINEVTDLYSYIAEEKNILIRTELQDELNLVADRNRLQQAIANLLDNAIKYTPAGGCIDIQTFQEYQNVIIRIKDNGIGVYPQELPKIWDRLYRGDKSRSQRGLGLGLSLVKAIIQAHKGHVEVSSVSGEGSVFTVYIPGKP
ncbi:MAG: HAMP domain-containing sensor histidine kinase [Nitrospiraceae bacterium]|nr:HAMP domain-containing sensor histidine kinase [Nitrospiraceae bacterium]